MMKSIYILLLFSAMPISSIAAGSPYQLLIKAMAMKQAVIKHERERGVSRTYHQYAQQKDGSFKLEQSWTINIKGSRYEYIADGVSVFADANHRLMINKVNKGIIIQRRAGGNDSLNATKLDQALSASLPKADQVLSEKLTEQSFGGKKYLEVQLTTQLSKDVKLESCYLLDINDSTFVGSKVSMNTTKKAIYNIEVSSSRLFWGLSKNILSKVYSKDGRPRKEYLGYKIVKL